MLYSFVDALISEKFQVFPQHASASIFLLRVKARAYMFCLHPGGASFVCKHGVCPQEQLSFGMLIKSAPEMF